MPWQKIKQTFVYVIPLDDVRNFVSLATKKEKKKTTKHPSTQLAGGRTLSSPVRVVQNPPSSHQAHHIQARDCVVRAAGDLPVHRTHHAPFSPGVGGRRMRQAVAAAAGNAGNGGWRRRRRGRAPRGGGASGRSGSRAGGRRRR